MAPVRKYGDGAPVVNAAAHKPLRADARRNRERVLAAAAEAFADDGIAVPLDDIARRAGVGAGTVYRHFPTKEALFEAVMVERMQRLGAEAHARAAEKDAQTALLGFIRHLLAEAAPKRDLVDALTHAGVDLHRSLKDIADQMRDDIAGMLRRAQRAGEIRRDVTISDLMALLSGVIAAGQAGHHPDERPPSIERLADVVCEGLRRPVRRG
jgi:AcrR family transcriptional regulator